MTSPRVSIVTPVFNGAQTLQKTIDSVLGQSFTDLEWIIVDGGSTDTTLDILKNISSSKIWWRSEPDQGIYDAMNQGIQMSSGEWIYFLGADDSFYQPDTLKNIFDEKEYSEDLIYGDVYDLKLGRPYDGPFDLAKILIRNICHQSIFYRRSLFYRLGHYNIDFRLMADWDFNLRCFHDPLVSTKYIPVIVACFAEGGASAAYDDVEFFRNSLFTYRFDDLQKNGWKQLRSLPVYDRWWRLFRSMRLPKDTDPAQTLPRPLPRVMLSMIDLQKRFSAATLQNGVISKSLMFYNYCTNRMGARF